MPDRSVAVIAPSVIASWTRTIVTALTAQRVDPAPVLARSGVSPALLADPAARIPLEAMRTLWKEAAIEVGDPAFGLRVSKYLRHSTFHALGYAVLASSTLREALERMVRFNRIVSDAGELTLTERGSVAELRIQLQPGYEGGGEESTDALLSAIVRACRALLEKPFPLHEVTLRRTAPADASPYEGFFKCPVRFEVEDGIFFDKSLLDEPLAAANPTLARHNDDAARDYLARVQSGTLVDRVRGAIVDSSLTRGDAGIDRTGLRGSAQRVAQKLGMSLRSLQRSLKEHGTSYEAVLSELRRELACAYLRDDRYTLAEVAFLLGYEHESAFARAFKRWTGTPPSEFARSRKTGA